MSATWKPCDRLTPDDFSRIAVWTHDAARAARDDHFDETWVRPARAGDALDDEVFVRATITDRDGKPVPRCVLTLAPGARKGAKPVATALVVLSPFASTPIEGQALSPSASPAIQRLLPIKYEVDVKIGATRVRAEGRITQRNLEVTSASADDGEAEQKRQALIEAALAKRNAELARASALAAKQAAAKPVAKQPAPRKAAKPVAKQPAKPVAKKKPLAKQAAKKRR